MPLGVDIPRWNPGRMPQQRRSPRQDQPPPDKPPTSTTPLPKLPPPTTTTTKPGTGSPPTMPTAPGPQVLPSVPDGHPLKDIYDAINNLPAADQVAAKGINTPWWSPVWASDTPPTNPAGDLAAQYDAWIKAQQGINYSNYETDYGLATSLNGVNNRALEDSIGNQRALNAEGKFRNNLNVQENQNNADLLGTQRGITQAQYMQDVDWINKTWGLNKEQYAADIGNMKAMEEQLNRGFGFAEREFDIANRGTTLQQTANNQSAMSDATGRGAMLSQGHGDAMTNIATQAGIGFDTNQLGFDMAKDRISGNIRDLQYQMGSRDRSFAGDNNNFTHQLNTLGNTYKNNMAQLDTALANNSLANSALASMAREYGIRDKDLQQTLAHAVEKNNINMNQLISQMTQVYQTKDQGLISQFNQMLATLIGG